MEVLGVAGDRFLTPLQTGRQEPGEGHDHPPGTGCHAEEVDQQEDDGAGDRTGCLVPSDLGTGCVDRIAGDLVVPEHEPNDVPDADEEIAEAQQDYGSFRVLEPLHVDHERQQGQSGRDAAEDRPQSDPEVGELHLFVAEVDASARDRAVRYSTGPYPVVVQTRFVDDSNQSTPLARAILGADDAIVVDFLVVVRLVRSHGLPRWFGR